MTTWPALVALGAAIAHQKNAEYDVVRAVADARDAGHSWAAIGRQLGMTRQAAWERWSRRVEEISTKEDGQR